MSELHVSAATPGNNDADTIKVMVVDDALVIRGLLTRMLEKEGDISVVASAGDGEKALSSLKRVDVDVIILDVEMPNMDGIEALPKIIQHKPDIQIIMASTLTKRNAEVSMKALELGAADYVTKPGSSSAANSADDFKRDLLEKIRSLGTLARRRRMTSLSREAQTSRAPLRRAQSSSQASSLGRSRDIHLVPQTPFQPQALAIGSSTGGPQALLKILKDLGRISQPVFITQHMPATFTTILAAHISRSTGQKCLEGANHMEVQPGHIYLAPGGMHMIMKRHGSKVFIHLSDGPQENFCRPAIDPMLRSLSDIYGNKLFITILTGMGADGTKGSRYSVEAGAQVIAQDEASSVVWGMPGSVAMAGICGAILPLDKIGAEMQRFAVKGGR